MQIKNKCLINLRKNCEYRKICYMVFASQSVVTVIGKTFSLSLKSFLKLQIY